MTAPATALDLAGRGLGLDYGTFALVENDERWSEAFEQLAKELRAARPGQRRQHQKHGERLKGANFLRSLLIGAPLVRRGT